jgi:predicted nucleic acid-binding protein
LLALAAPNDRYHQQARHIAGGFIAAGGRLFGTALVLAELHALVLHRANPAAARAGIGALIDDPAYQWFDVTIDLERAAADAWLTRYHDQRFSLADAVSFEVMRREGIRKAFAFDRDFVTAGYELLG